MSRLFLSCAALFGVMASTLPAQTEPSGFHSVACIKVQPGKMSEYQQFVKDYTHKMAETNVSMGNTSGWALLRSVLPQGEEARCDYVVVGLHRGIPTEPSGLPGLEKIIQKSGLKITPQEFLTKRSSLTKLVSMAMWQEAVSVAAPQKGDYMQVNFARIPNMTSYIEFERNVWKPMAETWVKEGRMRAWRVNRAVHPSGTELFGAVSIDVFPSWKAVYTPLPVQSTFDRVHPGKNFDQTFEPLPKLRNLARRELYVVEDMIGGPASK